jgi:hypothetical protein
MKPLRCWFALILTALAPAVFAAEFEGIVQMKMTDSRSTHTLQYQVKEGFVRTDIQISPGKASSVIMDFKNKRMIILMPGQNMYMTRPFPDSLSAPASRPANGAHVPPPAMPQKTGETKTILGYRCTKYVSQAGGSTVEMWVTDELGNFAGLGGGAGGRGSPLEAWEKALVGRGFFPLLISGKSSSGKPFSLEIISVDRQSLPDSVFAPPAGAREFNMGNMFGPGGVLGGQRPN